jgi:hypothetical protein
MPRPQTSDAIPTFHPTSDADFRPSTAPTAIASPAPDLGDLLSSLPPRRELPFGRYSNSRPPDTIGSSKHNRSSSSLDLPPLPTPRFVDNAASPKKQTNHTPVATSPSATEKGCPAAPEQFKKPAHPTPLPPLPSSNPAELDKTSTPKLRPPTANPEAARLERIAPYLPRSVEETKIQDQNLLKYVDQATEKRRAELDELLMKLLHDESFVQLCEDVEQSWRARIGIDHRGL